MKKNLYLLTAFILMAAFSSCESCEVDEGDFKTTHPVLSPLGQTEWILAKPESGDNPYLFRLNWTKARFTYPSGNPAYVDNVNYTVQFDLADNQFSKAVSLSSTNALYSDVYAQQLFDIVVSLSGGEQFELQTMAIRVKVDYPNGESVYSDEILFTVKEPAPTQVRWRVTGGSWDEMAVYVWGDGELFGGWPGLKVTPDAQGWYSITVPYKFNANVIINNNGNNLQHNLVSIPAQNATDVALYVNLETGDIFTSWPVSVNWTVMAGNWIDMYVYSWGDDIELFGKWPGKKLLANPDGSFSVNIPSEGNVNLIINNNSGLQVNLISSPKEDIALYVDLNTGEVSSGPKVVKWKVVNGSWDAMALYSWGTDNALHGSWPGTLVTPDDYGWYSIPIPPGYDQNLIINNNGGGKQLNMPSPTVNAQYEVDLDNGTFVQATQWSITIKWKQPADEWGGQMAIYAWGGNPNFDTFGGWPGKTVTADANGWYSATVPPGQTVGNAILNNNGSGKQFDINLSITTDVWLEVTGNSFAVISGL
jgi:hypothetical protein